MTAVLAPTRLYQRLDLGHYCNGCGGLLSPTGARTWTHTGRCIDCTSDGSCAYPAQHTGCPDTDPQPAPCDHDRAGCRPADLFAGACTRGLDNCCGCCHDDDSCVDYDR